VAWREPLTLEAVAAIDAAGSIDLRRFLGARRLRPRRTVARRRPRQGRGAGRPRPVGRRLSQFVDLGGVGLKGTMTRRLPARGRAPDGLRQLTAQAEFKGLELALKPGRVWKDETLTAKANAILKPMGTGANYSVEGGVLGPGRQRLGLGPTRRPGPRLAGSAVRRQRAGRR
jgi:hypothetical protein